MAAEGRGQFRHDVRDASEIEGGFPKAFGFLVWGLWLQERTEYCSPMHTTLPWKDSNTGHSFARGYGYRCDPASGPK